MHAEAYATKNNGRAVRQESDRKTVKVRLQRGRLYTMRIENKKAPSYLGAFSRF
jgi:hypothetical protein